MPFGKHKDVPLTEIPLDYLEWLAHVPDLHGWLKSAVEEELDRREWTGDGRARTQEPPPRQEPPPPVYAGRIPAPVTSALALDLVEAGRRALARKHHPDAGGDGQTMSAVNVTADWLGEHLRSTLRGR